MKKLFWFLLVFDIALIAFLISMLDKAEGAYVNSEDGLCVRAEKSTDSEILEVLPFGTEVHGKFDGEWMRLSGQKGFICTEYIQDTDPLAEMAYWGVWRVTAYAYTGSACANGQMPTAGYTIAHNSLPFGTEVYIEGVGFRTVEDRGPAWLGEDWCDLYLGEHGECVQWGNQYRKVWVR